MDTNNIVAMLPVLVIVPAAVLVTVLLINRWDHFSETLVSVTQPTTSTDDEEDTSVGDDFAMPAQAPALGFGSPIEAQLLVAADYGRRAPHRMRLRELPIACPGCLAEELRRRARAGQMPPEHYPQYYPVLCALHAETLPSLPAVQVVKEKAN